MLNVNLHIGFFITSLSILYGIRVSFFRSSYPIVKSIILFYIAFNILTGFLYIFNELPTLIYINEIQNQIFPVVFFFIGNNTRDIDSLFYKSTLIGSIFMFIVGLYLYFKMPEWYLNWKIDGLYDWIGQKDVASVALKFGLSSFFYTPYYTGYFSFVTLTILLSYFYRTGLNILKLFLFCITLSVLILAQMRVVWIVGTIMIIYSIFNAIINRKKIGYSLLFISLILLSTFYFYAINQGLTEVLDLIFDRFSSLNYAVSERSDTWNFEIRNIFDFLFGHGLGTRSHSAASFGYPSITDGEYFKIFHETGFIGLCLLLTILLASLIRAYKYYEYFFIEFFIVFFFLFSGIGANPFSMPIIIIICWFSLGRIWNENYLNSLKINSLKQFF